MSVGDGITGILIIATILTMIITLILVTIHITEVTGDGEDHIMATRLLSITDHAERHGIMVPEGMD